MSYRTNTALPSSKKTHSEKHKQILKQLLRETANKSCADCKVTKNPRWASWNLGCFVCIRCSGIHRSMGTHISKVKSVDLDAWTDDQIENMIKWGNEKSNYFWEQKLPEGYTPDQSKIESFIRTKYDIKKWAGSTIVPDPLTISIPNSTSTTTSSALSNNSTSSSLSSTTSSSTTSTSIKAPQPKSANLLDDDFGDFTSSPSSTPTPTPIPSSTAYGRSLPKAASTTANLAPPIPTPPQPRSQSAQSTGGSITSNGRPDLKKSILSLYSSPSASTSFLQPQQSVRNQSFSPSLASPSPVSNNHNNNNLNINSLSNSLSGLQFGGTSTSSTIKQTPSNISSSSINATPINNNNNTLSSSSTSNNSWKNEWNDSSSSSLKNQWNQPVKTTNSNNIGLDDDLFKNVWD
ncbi:zinc finger protein [Scheffersomyces coipomensis]|uniref:zinc finger protein n=1 Tax=Scheffersomyces coipomensis TaxID=1788519 RepID=UPI00315D471F